MYYRWTEKARPFISSYDGEVVGKWKRIRCSELLKKYPQYWQWVRQGDMEIKDESNSPLQSRNRKFFILEGQTVAVENNIRKLIREHEALWPNDWNRYHALTYCQMNAMHKLGYFLEKLRKEREDNKDKPTGN